MIENLLKDCPFCGNRPEIIPLDYAWCYNCGITLALGDWNQRAEDKVEEGRMPRSRFEAKEIGFRYYFTGKHCTHGHIARRLTSTTSCVECAKLERQK